MKTKSLLFGMTVLLAASLIFMACPPGDDGDKTTAVTGVSIGGATTQVVAVGETLTLTATVAPTDATNKTVAWSSGTPAAATVNATMGVVTGVAAGTSVITATTSDGSKTATVTVTVIPTIGISTTGFDTLSIATLPSGVTNKDSFTEPTSPPSPQVTGVEASRFWQIAGNKTTDFRTNGAKAVTWDNSTKTSTFWTDTSLDAGLSASGDAEFGSVRADVRLESAATGAANAYLLVYDGTNTTEVIKTGFIGFYRGSDMTTSNGLNKVSSLTFGATAAGTYTVKIVINKVNPANGTVVGVLAQQTLTFIVAAAAQ